MTPTHAKTKAWLRAALLAFVLISIGYALGKEMTLRRLQAARPQEGPGPAGAGNRVVLYYMHPTLRCVTCNEMEKTILDLVRTEFAEPLAEGRLRWKEVNFEENEALARRYNVATSSLVVVRFREGRETDHQTLEEIWTLKDEPGDLRAFVREAIRSRLNGTSP
ncbi:MAG: nitrophenyl compound nitroreductase subunit ArsF family protein [Phycisphaerae bacterium]